MLFTPVFWVPSPEVIPEIAPWLPWVELNPMHHLLVLWRSALLGGRPEFLFEGELVRSVAVVLAESERPSVFVGFFARNSEKTHCVLGARGE